MNSFKIVSIIIIISLTSCKSTSKMPIICYGNEEKLLIYNNKEMINGDVTLSIGNYKFFMKYSDLNESLNTLNKQNFQGSIDKELPKNRLFSLIEYKDFMVVNNTDTIRFPDNLKYELFLDNLFKNEKMYFEKSGLPIQYLEYIHWKPQYQGAEVSKWIDKDKLIKEVTWAMFD